MKTCVLVIGKPNAGKSTTIRNFKAKVGLGIRDHVFTLNDKTGYINATSFEEKSRPIEKTIDALSGYELLLFAVQGKWLDRIKAALQKASFKVREVRIKSPTEAKERGEEVYQLLSAA